MGQDASETRRHDADWRFYRWLGGIAIFALVVRLAMRLVVGTDTFWTDGYSMYVLLAESLSSGHGYAFPGEPPTAFRVPLYPMFIAALTGGARNAWVLITAQALISSGTAVIAGLIARRMGGSLAGLLAAVIYAAWPYEAWHDVSLQESGLFAFLAALATLLLLAQRQSRSVWLALLAGAVLGAALLTRATLAPYAVLALICLLLPDRNHALGRRMISAALTLAALATVLSPWLERSHRLTGRTTLGTESGAALYAGNHRLTFSAYPERSIDISRRNIFAAHTPQEQAELARLGADQAAVSDWYRDQAIRAIMENPGRFAIGALRKIWAAFGPLPTPRHGLLADLAYAVCWVPFFALALAGLWLQRKQWRDDLLLHAHLITFAATTALFWAQTSHRSYLDPYLAVFAAITLAALFPQRWRNRLES